MQLTKKEAMDIIELEIRWCLENPDPHLNPDQQLGFINGLRQAKLLIMNAERVVRSTMATPNRHDVQMIDRTDGVANWDQ